MPWRYCLTCDQPIGPPTIIDAIVGGVECKCGETWLMDNDEQRIYLEPIERLTDE